MIAIDTSVVVALFASWHEHHDRAEATVPLDARVIAQCAVESYSVLTRLPPPHRSRPQIVRDFLEARFPQHLLTLTPDATRAVVLRLPELGITGGAAYDALVAATAATFSAQLVSLDVRALATYDRCGVDVRFIG